MYIHTLIWSFYNKVIILSLNDIRCRFYILNIINFLTHNMIARTNKIDIGNEYNADLMFLPKR